MGPSRKPLVCPLIDCIRDNSEDSRLTVLSPLMGSMEKTPRIRSRVEVKGKSLADFPDVLAQWHPTKNDEIIVDRNNRSPNYGNVISPGEIAAGSQKKYWWKCPEGPDHEWEAALGSRTQRNVGCPFCANQRVCNANSLSQLYPEISRIWHPTKNGETTPSDIVAGSAKKRWWKCPNGSDHEWEVGPAFLIRSFNEFARFGCPFCYGKKTSVTNRLDLNYPEIAEQWHPTLNGELLPEQVVAYSGKKVWWKCPNGPDHEWRVPVSARTSAGRKCPFCANQRVCSTNSLRARFPEICSEWHPSLNGDLTPDDVLAYTGKRVWWKCDKGPDHEWKQTPSVRLSMGTGCPYCANLAVSVTNALSVQFPELVRQWHPSLNGELLPGQVVSGSGKRVWWKCSVADDHEWRTSIHKRTNGGQGCPCCAIPIRKIVPSNSLASTHPEILEQWDYDRNKMSPTEVAAGSPIKVYWICQKGHSYSQGVANKALLNAGCIYCAGQKVLPDGSNSLAAEYPDLIEEWDVELNAPITPWQVRPMSHKKVHWKCRKPECGFDWSAQISSRTSVGTNCPACVESGFNQGKSAFLYLFALRRKAHDGVLFYKLGISNNAVEQRFTRFTKSVTSVPRFADCYTTEEEVIAFDSGKDALWLETELKGTEELRYHPNEDFEGKSESFILNPLEFARIEGLL